MDFRLELVLLPVSNVDRAKQFYVDKLGFALDVDHQAGDEFRVVQMTPPGSACSISVGVGITDAVPGSVRGTHLTVEDIVAARDELAGRGIDISAVQHFNAGTLVPGVDPEARPFNSYAFFSDPDGNSWVLQHKPA